MYIQYNVNLGMIKLTFSHLVQNTSPKHHYLGIIMFVYSDSTRLIYEILPMFFKSAYV